MYENRAWLNVLHLCLYVGIGLNLVQEDGFEIVLIVAAVVIHLAELIYNFYMHAYTQGQRNL